MSVFFPIKIHLGNQLMLVYKCACIRYIIMLVLLYEFIE